jgi:hypothetical protein
MYFWQQCPWLTFITSEHSHAASAKLPSCRLARNFVGFSRKPLITCGQKCLDISFRILSTSLALNKTPSLLWPVVKDLLNASF